MIFDRALANLEICGDVFVWMAGENEVHDLPLTPRKARDAVCRLVVPSRQLWRSRSNACSTLASNSFRLIGFSMKSEAPAFMV